LIITKYNSINQLGEHTVASMVNNDMDNQYCNIAQNNEIETIKKILHTNLTINFYRSMQIGSY